MRIKFVDFWEQLDRNDNYFTRVLSKHFNLEISDNPEVIIYSVCGQEHRKYDDCIKVWYTGENRRPNYAECDYSLSFDYINSPRNYRLPLYALDIDRLCPDFKPLLSPKPNPQHTKFCNFLYNNGAARERIEFFHELCKYKHVDARGCVMNNMGNTGQWLEDKVGFLSDYKFTIAFENSLYPGYTTEKIVEPMIARSLPIYWGNPLVDRDFNPKSFISGGSIAELVQKVIEIDKSDELYAQYMNESYFHNNQINEFIHPDNIGKYFQQIMNQGKVRG